MTFRTLAQSILLPLPLRISVPSMARWGSVAVTVVSFLLGLPALAFATSPTRPSDRACLISWNSRANRTNHLKLLALRPPSGLQLLPAVVGTDSWSKGSTPAQTSEPACLMTFAKSGAIREITGIWKAGAVAHRSFGHGFPVNHTVVANVRLLPDGRVTKIYLH